MPLRRLIVISSLVLGVAALSPAAALAAANGTDRPLMGNTTSTTVDLIGGPSGPTTDGSGKLSLLGAVTFHGQVTAFTVTGPNTFTQAGTTTLVAANGDKLFLTYTGSGTINGADVGSTIQSTTVDTVTGGTGRFASASGTYTTTISSVITAVTASSVTTSDTSTIEGHISY